MMQYTTLGHTDLKVSKICLGTMTFGEQNNETEGHQQLDYALDAGINFIDTAEMYPVPPRAETQGATERIVGSWIKARNNRDQFILATKVTGPSPRFTYLRDPIRFDRVQISTALENSLRRLQTDYIDLYQLHWPERRTNYFGQLAYRHDPGDPWEDNLLEVLQILCELQREGKIRHFGISNETPWGLMRFLVLADQHDLPRCVSIQNPYSLLNRTFEIGLAEIAIRERAGLLAYSPLAFGLLSGKYHQGMDAPGARLNRYAQMARYNGDLSYEATSAYLDIAETYDLSLTQMALAFINRQPFLTSNIIGATTMQQLRENIESIQIKLTDEILDEIEAVHLQIPNPAP